MQKKRKIITLLLVSFALVNGFSQFSGPRAKNKNDFNYGFKVAAGPILVRAEKSEIGNSNDYVIYEVEIANTDPKLSIGAFAEKRFGWLYAQGSSMVSRYGVNYDITYYTEGEKITERSGEDFTYFDMQVMGGLIDNGFKIGVGPMMHILAGQRSELTSLENYNQVLRKVSYGFSGSVGYVYGKFGIELKYDNTFRTVGDHVYYGNKKSLYKESPDALMLQVSYNIK
jgi:hypothetical protein